MFFINHKVRLRTYQAGLLQAKAHRVLTSYMTEALAPYGISLPEWALLGLLKDHKVLRPSEIADHLGVKPPVATAHLKRLDSAGLIHRNQPADDSRVVEISLTPEGIRKVDTIESRLRVDLRGFLKGIKVADLITYIRVLAKLADKS
jgi:DNA-binding MarR family transcriptional regulator